MKIFDKFWCELLMQLDEKKNANFSLGGARFWSILLVALGSFIYLMDLELILYLVFQKNILFIPILTWGLLSASLLLIIYFRYIKNNKYLIISEVNNYKPKGKKAFLFVIMSCVLFFMLIIFAGIFFPKGFG